MADIAFLLLVFFLVTTTIQTDSGVRSKLPPYVPPDEEIPFKKNKRNVFSIQLNSLDRMLVRDKPLNPGDWSDVTGLRDRVKEFVLNPSRRQDLAETPKKAVIILLNDNGTSYGQYLAVYNELKAASNEAWDERAQDKHGKPYLTLTKQEQKDIRAEIPFIISEAEPTENEIAGGS